MIRRKKETKQRNKETKKKRTKERKQKTTTTNYLDFQLNHPQNFPDAVPGLILFFSFFFFFQILNQQSPKERINNCVTLDLSVQEGALQSHHHVVSSLNLAAKIKEIAEFARNNCLFCEIISGLRRSHQPNSCQLRYNLCFKCCGEHRASNCPVQLANIEPQICKMCCLPKKAHGFSFHEESEWATTCGIKQIPEFVIFAWRKGFIPELSSVKDPKLFAEIIWNDRDSFQMSRGAQILSELFQSRPLKPNTRNRDLLPTDTPRLVETKRGSPLKQCIISLFSLPCFVFFYSSF